MLTTRAASSAVNSGIIIAFVFENVEIMEIIYTHFARSQPPKMAAEP